MPILDNEFTCPDGHTFRANAKLRATCPTCTKMARRRGSNKTEGGDSTATEPTGDSATPPVETPPAPTTGETPVAGVARVLRQGRSMPPRKPAVPSNPPKKVPVATVKRVSPSAGMITKRKAPRGDTPRVNKRPKQFAQAKITATGGGKEPFWIEMARRAGFKV